MVTKALNLIGPYLLILKHDPDSVSFLLYYLKYLFYIDFNIYNKVQFLIKSYSVKQSLLWFIINIYGLS